MMHDVVSRTISQDAMAKFAELPADRFPGLARGVKNHHTDPEIARKAGLSAPVAQALHYCAFISQSMLDTFGQRWLEGGEMEMVFFQPVYAGDTVTVELTELDDRPGALDVACGTQAHLVATGTTRVSSHD